MLTPANNLSNRDVATHSSYFAANRYVVRNVPSTPAYRPTKSSRPVSRQVPLGEQSAVSPKT